MYQLGCDLVAVPCVLTKEVVPTANSWPLIEALCLLQFKTNKVIYRRYAGLYFSLCVDVTDNELAYLESIHLLVEILDHYFSNVCELDLVFNFHKVPSCHESLRRCPQPAPDMLA